MPLIADATFASLRRALAIALTHTYTRTPAAAGTGEDDWGETDPVAGTAVAGVSCRFATLARVVRDAGGTTTVDVPTLAVDPTDPLKVGDTVSNVVGSDGVVIQAGPFRVERLLDDTAGLGAALQPVYELRGAGVQS
jgi:hypothetical protein